VFFVLPAVMNALVPGGGYGLWLFMEVLVLVALWFSREDIEKFLNRRRASKAVKAMSGAARGRQKAGDAADSLASDSAHEQAMREVDRLMYGSTPEELASALSTPSCPACRLDRSDRVSMVAYSGPEVDPGASKAWKCPTCGHIAVSVD
jgi:hypothetical protein